MRLSHLRGLFGWMAALVFAFSLVGKKILALNNFLRGSTRLQLLVTQLHRKFSL